MGHEVSVCSAYGWADYPIPELEFETNETMALMERMFGADSGDNVDERALDSLLSSAVARLKDGFNKALADFSRAIVIRPDAGRHYLLRSRCHFASGDVHRARADARRARELGTTVPRQYLTQLGM